MRERRRTSCSSRTAARASGSTTRRFMTQYWPQRVRARELLAKEVGYVSKPHGGRMRVALAFPNTYFVGMSNLGFQTVYTLFNAQDDIVCERVFLPPKSELAAQLASRAPALTLEAAAP